MIKLIMALFGYIKFPNAAILLGQKNSDALKFLIDGCTQDLKYLSEMLAANPDHGPMRGWVARKTLELAMLKKALEGQDELVKFLCSTKKLSSKTKVD